MSSDNVELFCYTSNLTAGATWTSNPLILGQYISLSVVAKADQDLTIVFGFSGDGQNFDYNLTRNLPAGDNTVLDSPVHAKWSRISVTNSSIVDTTYLRVYVYGVPSNASLTAQIGKIGNIDPAVQVSNLPKTAFGELMTCEDVPQVQYYFVNGMGGDLLTEAWVLPYSDLHTWASAAGFNLYVSGGVASIGRTLTYVGDTVALWGAPFRYHPGQGIESKFTAFFKQGLKSVPNGYHPTTEYVGIGNFDSATNKPNDGYFFGYGDPSGAPDNFGIVYLNAGTRTFYPRTSWNRDKADGSNILPSLDFSQMQIYEITFQYLGFGMVRFYMENPSSGEMVLVHVIERINQFQTPTNLSNPSLGLIMYCEIEAGVQVVSITDEVGVGSFCYTLQGTPLRTYERYGFEALRAGITSEQCLFNLRCDSTFYGAQNYWPVDIDMINISTDGTKSVIIRIYRNATITGPTWSAVNANGIPLSIDKLGTFTVAGTYLMSFTLAKVESRMIYLDDFHLHLNPGDIITITGQSSSSNDIFITGTAQIH